MNWRARLADWISGGLITYWYRRHCALADAMHSIARNTCCEGCQEAARVAQKAILEAGKT